MNAVNNSRVSQTNRFDGMLNVLNILSGQRQSGPIADRLEADMAYSSDGLAATIVDKPAEDVMGASFEIDGDPNETIKNEMERLDAFSILTDCIRWTRLHGGGAILMLINDGQPLTSPLNYNNINMLEDLLVYPAVCITPTSARYNDPTRKNYGWPEVYNIKPMTGNTFTAHDSRLIKMSGDPLPGSVIDRFGIPWIGKSALEPCWKAICRYNTGMMLAQGILERKTQLVYKMSDLGGMLAQGLDDVVAKRVNMADSARNIFNMLAVDALDDVTLADTSLGGLDAVIKDMRIDVAAKARMPMAILFGEQAGGLNANTQETTIYHALLEGIRKQKLLPALQILSRTIWAQKSIPEKEPQRWLVKFESLASPQPKELADVQQKKEAARKLLMESVKLAGDMQVFDPEELRAATALAFPELNLGVAEPALPDDIPDDFQTE